MKTLFCILLHGFWQSGNPTQPPKFLREFMYDVVSQQLTTTALEEKYFCSSLAQQQSVEGDTVQAVAGRYLSLLKSQLNAQKVKPEELVFTPFNSLNNKLFEIIGGSDDVYVATYHDEVICYFLIKENKINTFTLFNTGPRAFFISFCK